MQHLTPVGLSKDGKSLVLVSNAGEEFAVPVDNRLRAALRGDHARLGQLEMKMESALRPRDIQARIRGGESAEEVAAAAQTTVDAIMGFAAPVLAERAHVAESAQKSSIRRKSTDATTAAGTLDQAARTHLSTVGVRFDDVSWDAWRREDGRWALVAEYAVSGGPRRAEFIYDQPGRYVVADNQEARLLTGEATPAAAGGSSTRRLSSVPSSNRADDELPLADHELGDDAIELVRDRAAAEAAQAPVEDPAFEYLAADHADADWMTQAGSQETAGDEQDETAVVDGAAPVDEPTTPAAAAPDDEGVIAQDTTEVARPAKPQKKGRSSVPSWDEIMFGGGKGE
jgi:Protein of unknown function (DUF3071)